MKIVNHLRTVATRLHEILPGHTGMAVELITVFLKSLTEHWDGKLIAVIVSGFDGDGGYREGDREDRARRRQGGVNGPLFR